MSVIQCSKVTGVHVHIYTYNKQSQLQSLFWVVSMTYVHLRDVAKCCCGPFSHRACTQLLVFARDLYSSWSWNTTNSSTPVRYLERKHAHTTWPTALPSLSFTIIVSGLGKSIHRVIVFLGSFYSGNVVIGHSIYGVVVIDGSLYSQFYSMSQSSGIGWDVPPLNFTPRHMILGQVVLGLRTSCPQEQLVLYHVSPYSTWSQAHVSGLIFQTCNT